jgi:hypothetical protein
MSHRALHILIAGMMAGDLYQGGATWAVLQYILGLRALGHEVTFIEPVAAQSLRPAGASIPESENAQYLRHVSAEFGLHAAAGLLVTGSKDTLGLTYEQMLRAASKADLLINISGMLTDEAILERVKRRIYLDLDPAFNQFWHAQGIDVRLAGHTDFVTIGQAIGSPGCNVPTCGVNWLKTWQPIMLDQWPVCTAIETDAFTTIGNWRAYGSITHGGVFYGQKAHSLRRFIELPQLTRERFCLAMDIHPNETGDLDALRANGWQLLNPVVVAGTTTAYRRFVQSSFAEFGIAKSGYVESQCGWFSDRSVCYLASGRPVVVQDTGIRPLLPNGTGLLTFSNIDDLVAAVESTRSNYALHARAARDIAEEFFDSHKVLAALLSRLQV